MTSANLDAINILKGLAYSQQLLEDQKIALISSGYFNEIEVFEQIDRKGTSKIYSHDLINYLSVHRIAISERQSQYLIWISGSRQPFMTYQHFKWYISNGYPDSIQQLRASILGKNQYSGDQMIKNYSHKQLALIFEKEIEYYRKIQVLRQQYIKKYGFQFKNIMGNIDIEKKGYVNFNMLLNFIHRHNVQFSNEQFEALSKKLFTVEQNKISYKELMRAFTPFEPLTFPTYRKQNNMQKALNYITQELGRLNIDTQTVQYQNSDHPKKTATGFQKTIEQYRNPATKGKHMTGNYFYDQNYYNQLKQYKTGYFDPNKNVKAKVQNSMIGPQYHDHFFSDYYVYLEQRNKSEYYYNKFGKKYAFEQTVTYKN